MLPEVTQVLMDIIIPGIKRRVLVGIS